MIDRPITFAAAGLVVSGERGYTLEQGGFAYAVFTNDDGDGALETQFEAASQERETIGVGGGIGYPR